MGDYDWYISPAERFAAETQFNKYSEDEEEVALNHLEQLFQLSRLSQHEFSQIWQIVDIRMRQRINLEQFVYFSHILNTRRKGKPIPSGIPLDVKETFLKQPISTSSSVRASTTGRDVGASHGKSIKELEDELEKLSTDVRLAQNEEQLAKEHLQELEMAKGEVDGLADYKRRELAALQSDASKTGSSAPSGISSGAGTVEELLGKLKAEKEMLKRQQGELQQAVNAL
ncbi:hypothetical protein DFJ77DRAFT_508654 [Powellomyces hirtus]|nr:hypothetical protein DFJ77DRAFT_508654 [Powellomyces hirtus]